MVVRFAKCINGLPHLKEIWKQAKVPGITHYQKMIKLNSQYAKQTGISIKNVITPPGIAFDIDELILTPSGISFIVKADSLKLKKLFTNPSLIHLVLYFYSPKVRSKQAYNFCGMTVQNDHKHQRDITVFNVNISEEIASSLKSYKHVLIFISLSLLRPENEKVYWTSTFSKVIAI
jgi:hypothetical protein